MSKSATLTISYGLSGDGIGAMPVAATVTNAASVTPTRIALSAGDNTLTAPSGVTVNGVLLLPPSTSTNAKTVKAASGDTNTGYWTNQPIVYPVTAGNPVHINSTGSEAVDVYFF